MNNSSHGKIKIKSDKNCSNPTPFSVMYLINTMVRLNQIKITNKKTIATSERATLLKIYLLYNFTLSIFKRTIRFLLNV